MSGALELPAPAKLNLFLHVLGRRADGYHDLETLFVFLDHGDTVRVAPRDDGRIERPEGPRGLAARDDLCVRAAELLKAVTAARGGLSIRLRKRLPMGGGLGGGSSDAATVLLAANRLWGTGLGEDALAELGRRLGADVPVFVRGRAGFASGIGERLQPIALPVRWYLVACPGVEVSTAAIFAHPSLTRNTRPLKITGFPWLEDADAAFDALWRQTRNDCEPVTCAMHPQVRSARDWLRAQGHATRMTGTGGCVFAVFPSAAAARAAHARCPRALDAFVAQGLVRSPLAEALARPGRRAHGDEWGVAKR